MRILACAALAAVVLALSPCAAGEGALTEKARMFLDYQSFARGDNDGAVRFAIAASRELQGTPLAEMAVHAALLCDPAALSNVNVGEVEARRLMSSESEITTEHRDALRRFVARSFAASGRRADAMAIHERRGLAMSWLVAGPLPGDAGMEERELPGPNDLSGRDILENPPDEALFAAWRKTPRWRNVPENRSFPYLHPWSGVNPDAPGSMVLFTSLEMSDADNKAVFHVFAETSWRLYIDGALVSAVDRDDHEAPNEHIVSYPLSPGRHAVMLQASQPPAWVRRETVRVSLRLDSASTFAWDCDAMEPVPVHTVSARRDPKPLRFLEELEGLAAQNPTLMAAYAVACVTQGMPDAGAWWAEKAASAAPGDVTLQRLAGYAVSVNPQIPRARRVDIASGWHRMAVDAKPDLAQSLVHLAGAAMDSDRAGEAREYLDRAYAVNPLGMEVLLARVEWARRYGSDADARAALSECGGAFPNSPRVQITLSGGSRDGLLDMDKRLAACRAALESGPYIPEASMDLASALADAGNARDADFVLKNAVELFGGESDVLSRIGEIYARLGMYPEAVDALSAAIRVTPDNHRFWRRLGDFHMEAGNQDRAEKFWRVSLAANPGQFELRDMMSYLSDSMKNTFAGGDYDAMALTAQADASRYEGDVVRLLDRAVLMFAADGSYRRLTHEVDLARTRKGGESLAELDSRGELLTARIVFPNGNTLEPEPFPGRGGLRLPVIMPGAAKDVRVLESVQTRHGGNPIAPWFFQDPEGKMSLVMSEYVVAVPHGFPLVHTVRNAGADLDFETAREGDLDIYRWSASIGRSEKEPDSVHVSESIPSVEVGVRASWNAIVENELRLLSGRLVPSMRMRSLLETLCRPSHEGRPDPLGAAKMIYRYVCDNIDPTPAGDRAAHIHMDRMGDRNILLLSLLRAAGLDAHPAAARPSVLFMHPPAWDLPRRDMFTVSVVRLDIPGGKTYWLDTRFDSLPFGKVTDDLSGATVLTFQPGGPLFETLPVLPAEDSGVFEERGIRLPAADAAVEISGRSVVRGVAGLERDRILDASGVEARRGMLLAAMHPVFPDAELIQFEVLRGDESTASSQERYVVTARSPVTVRPGGARAVSLCLMPPRIVSDAARNLVRRRTACHVKANRVAEDRNVFRLPDGARFGRLPRPAHIPSRFGVYQLRLVKRGDGVVELIRNYHVPAQRIMPWDWDDFRAFLKRIDLAEKQWIEYFVENDPE